MSAATFVQQLCKSYRTCFMFYFIVIAPLMVYINCLVTVSADGCTADCTLKNAADANAQSIVCIGIARGQREAKTLPINMSTKYILTKKSPIFFRFLPRTLLRRLTADIQWSGVPPPPRTVPPPRQILGYAMITCSLDRCSGAKPEICFGGYKNFGEV